MKGITGFESLLTGFIMTYAIVVAILVPTATLKLDLDRQMVFEYKFEKSQNILSYLQALDGKFVFVKDLNTDDIRESLELNIKKLLEISCFSITDSESNKILSNCDTPEYSYSTFVVVPYHPDKLVEKVRVGIK